jgi:RNA 2',3'-cyclic 3'-phosphodiesterase
VRLFVALQIPEQLRLELAARTREFASLAPKLKWVRAENLHVTLKFIGHVPDEKLQPVLGALESVHMCAFAVHLRGLGFFPDEKRPRVFWMGIEAPPALGELASGIDQALGTAGFPLESRPFSAHLTLARSDRERLPEAFSRAVRESKSHFGSIDCREFHLIESKLKSSGAEYTTVRVFHSTDGA